MGEEKLKAGTANIFLDPETPLKMHLPTVRALCSGKTSAFQADALSQSSGAQQFFESRQITYKEKLFALFSAAFVSGIFEWVGGAQNRCA